MSTRFIAISAAAAVAGTITFAGAASARDQIDIVGSSTVFPFATAVAEKFGNKTDFKTPKVTSTGSGGGLKRFCKGVGAETPDITNASRRMKKKEWDNCQKAGVKDIVEFKIGFDGIVIGNATAAPSLKLTRQQVYLALAAKVPDPAGGDKLVANPYKKWSDIDPSLPDTAIEVLGPPPTSGTRDAFEELALGGGAKNVAILAELRGLKAEDPKIKEIAGKLGLKDDDLVKDGKALKGKSIFKKLTYHIRDDGPYIEAGENDNLIVSKLEANPKAVGVFGFSFLDQNSDKIKGAEVDGVVPTFEAISSGKYPVSRSLFFYVKKAHAGEIKGVKEFLAEWTQEGTFGEEGYLVDKGLIPLPEDAREAARKKAAELTVMTGEEELK